MALPGRPAVPPHRFGIALTNAPAIEVHVPEVVLSIDFALVRSRTVPPHRFAIVFSHTPASLVQVTEACLSKGVALLGRPVETTSAPARCPA